jgi:hypothetical protein
MVPLEGGKLNPDSEFERRVGFPQWSERRSRDRGGRQVNERRRACTFALDAAPAVAPRPRKDDPMTTRIALAALAVLAALGLTAPAADAASRFSLVLGLDESRLTGSLHRVYDEHLQRPTGGLAFRQALGRGWRLRSGVEASSRGGSRLAHVVQYSFFDSSMVVDSLGPKFRSDWSVTRVSVPLAIERSFGGGTTRPFVAARPELAWRVGGADPRDGVMPGPNRARAVELRLNAGAGVTFPDGWGGEGTAGLMGSFGLGDVFAAHDGPAGRSQSLVLRIEVAP